MLHASGVVSPDGRHLILMIAPHNTGKSTTALHLLRAGYSFLADGMALLRQHEQGFAVGGYPIGEVKLRDDVLSMFPEYTGQSVQVREQRKTVVNLRLTHAELLVETVIKPQSVHLCFVERDGQAHTQLVTMSVAEALPWLTANTVYWDKVPQLALNSTTLQTLLRVANIYHITIGTNPVDIVNMVDKLWQA